VCVCVCVCVCLCLCRIVPVLTARAIESVLPSLEASRKFSEAVQEKGLAALSDKDLKCT